MVAIVKEFEDKLSSYYGTNVVLVTIAMDTWLCSNMKELDSVVLCLEMDESQITY